MLKRKRHGRPVIDTASECQNISDATSSSSAPLRKSARFLGEERKAFVDGKESDSRHLPSPSSTELHKEASGQKRKQPPPADSCLDEHDSPREKKPQATRRIHEQEEKEEDQYDPVAYWASTKSWPEGFSQKGFGMSSNTSNKRRSESTHRADRLERLGEHGVFMKTSALIQKSSRNLCDDLCKGAHTPTSYSFPLEKIPAILYRVQALNEGRIQRDVTPWVVPSAETLFFCAELNIDYIGDEVQAEWSRCATMGGSRPKPDYAAGLLPRAFTGEEMQKLKRYASPMRPVLFTPELCFPFLMCEAKTGERGMNEADRQNIHSASIAVRAIIELYREAFGKTAPDRVKELYGKVLAFTVSHDNDRVCIYGHFAVATDDPAEELEFYRYQFALFSLSMNDGAERYKAYNFVRNVYDRFAPEHLQRISEATARLPRPAEKMSLGTSELTLEGTESQDASQTGDDAVFQKPGVPASFSRQMERQRQESKEKEERMERQMEQQRQQIDKLLEQIDQQRQETREEKERMERQMEQQRQQIDKLLQQIDQQRQEIREEKERMERQMREQTDQQKELISWLKQSKD